jgi:hypothetical protein
MKTLVVTKEIQEWCMKELCKNGFHYFYDNENRNNEDKLMTTLKKSLNKFISPNIEVSRSNFFQYQYEDIYAYEIIKFKTKSKHDKYIKDNFSLDEIFQSNNDKAAFTTNFKTLEIKIYYRLEFEKRLKEEGKI